MQDATNISNYKLIQTKTIAEIHADVFIYEHIKTGSQVMYVKAEDKNKVFCITFKTPPEDNTGCPHILEHSVLNGSKNFPSKDTFTELMKGSMKTFLNAFTASDKTMYPIASTNAKDFVNLMQVYLDAVFYPKMQTNEEILMQEGWHYELFKPEDDIVYKGVVYNEMKGAFSSPESVLIRYVEQSQFPDTPYHFESGGDPDFIPELTWKKFKAFHSKYYHPSNSRIFVYGDMDINETLGFIDEQYLKDFDKLELHNAIALQTPFLEPLKLEKTYPISAADEAEGKNYLSLNYTYGNVLDVNVTSALSTLKQILMDSPASPLKQAILDSNLAADSFAYMNDSNLQPTLSIICKHVRTEDIEPLKAIILATLQSLVANGIDKKLIEATINSKEFALREADMNHFPKGLYYNMVSLASWLHDGDPTSYLEFEPILAYLRQGLTEPLFENLIQSMILANPHSSEILLIPEKGLNEKKEAELQEKLAAYKASLTPKKMEKLIEANNKLLAWQNEAVSPADIEKIPCISKADISPLSESHPLIVEEHGDVTLLKHPIFTNGIVYFNAYFDLKHVALPDFQWLSLLVDLVGNLNTRNYTYAEINNEIDIHTGGISIDLSLISDNRDFENIQPKLVLSSKCIMQKVDKMLELLTEYGMGTLFTDTVRISQLIKETKSRIQMMILGSGHLVAIRRMIGQHSKLQKLTDMTEGLDYYEFLCDVEAKLEEDALYVANRLTDLLRDAVTKRNMLISITSDEADLPQIWEETRKFLDKIVNEKLYPAEWSIVTAKENTGYYAPVNVQYCAKGGNFVKHGYEYSGKMMVLTNILRNDFLMQELRVKGGAYGAMTGFARNGNMFFCSYRDPNLAESLAVYDQVAEYVANFSCSERDLEKYIIGTMSELEMPKTPSQKANESNSDFITGLTFADHQKIRTEVLSTTLDDIRGFAPLIKAVMAENQFCVFGSEKKIQDNAEIFDKVIPAISR